MDQNSGRVPRYPPNFRAYPVNPNIHQGYRPPFPNTKNSSSPCVKMLPLNLTSDLNYWGLLSPALFGTAGALFLSLCSDNNRLKERSGGTLLKLTLVGYAIFATVAVSFAITDVVTNSESPHDQLFYPVGVALVSIIVLFAAEYLLLYRCFPSSFKGNVGDDLGTQLFSFVYLSITSIATADLGDILPTNVTARALIATEIAFNLFILATGIQLLLAQQH